MGNTYCSRDCCEKVQSIKIYDIKKDTAPRKNILKNKISLLTKNINIYPNCFYVSFKGAIISSVWFQQVTLKKLTSAQTQILTSVLNDSNGRNLSAWDMSKILTSVRWPLTVAHLFRNINIELIREFISGWQIEKF